MTKTCPMCHRQFDAHLHAIYCTNTCAKRAAYRRRAARNLKEAVSDSRYQFILDNVDANTLAHVYSDVHVRAYPKDVRINGPLPPNVARPSDVILEKLIDHHVVYHASRELILDSSI